ALVADHRPAEHRPDRAKIPRPRPAADRPAAALGARNVRVRLGSLATGPPLPAVIVVVGVVTVVAVIIGAPGHWRVSGRYRDSERPIRLLQARISSSSFV